MSKVEPLTPINASYTGISKLNEHLDKIEAAFENTLSRDGSTPNQMDANIDLNDNQIINTGEPTLGHHVATKDYVDALALGGAVPIYVSEGIPSLNSYVDLKDIASPSADITYIVQYRAALGDLGYGEFDWDPTSVEADNGGTILQRSAGGTGRFKRRFQGPARSGWFLTPHPTVVQTTALQAFLNCHPDLVLDEGTHKSANVTIPANTKLSGSRNSILLFNNTTGAAAPGDPDNPHLTIGGDNVVIENITLDGSWTTDTVAGGYGWKHYGIYSLGTAGTNRNDMVLRNLYIKNYGDSGVYTEFVNNKLIENCEIERCGYAGTIGLSTDTGWVRNCSITNIFPGDSSQNAYGITETSTGANRAAQYIVLESNRVNDVPSWEGIDIHFGKHCIIQGNVITACAQGIAYENTRVGAPGDDIVIADNVIIGWSGATYVKDGRTHYKTGGIVCKGGAPAEYGTSLSIIGNNVTGMGDTRLVSSAAAIFFLNWDGVICTHNNIRDSYRCGISASFTGAGVGVINLICSFNQIINVAVQGGVCRGIDVLTLTEGTGVGNYVTGLASGTEKYYMSTSATKLFKFVIPRETLQANRTYYVRADGNDNNNGLQNTSGNAFLTVQAAIDNIVNNVDTNGKTVTIQLSAGTRTVAIAAKSYVGGGNIILKGDSSTPSNVLFQTTADCFTAVDVAQTSGVDQGLALGRYTLDGMKFESSAGSAIWAVGPVVVDFQNCNFGPCANHHVAAFFGARVAASGNYAISGSATTHLNAVDGTIDIRSRTVTLTGTPAFSGAFAQSARGAHVMVSSATFSGAATGVRFNATLNGVIFSNNAGATFIPGNATGTVSTGGRYDASATDPENEITSAVVTAGSAVALTTATTANVTSITLGPGTWRVTGSVAFDPGATTSITRMIGAINTTSVTIPTGDVVAGAVVGISYDAFVPGATGQNLFVGEAILTLTAASTTVYLIARANFTVSTLGAYGKIQAQRLA